jgi:hypothetical protein
MSVTVCDVGSGVGEGITVGLVVPVGVVLGVTVEPVVGTAVGEELSCGDAVGFAVGVGVTLGSVESCGMEKYARVPAETATIIMQSIARIEFFIFIASLLHLHSETLLQNQ